ncbi:MAG: urease accessory protein UreD [Rhizobiaceae bacterium]|nr:urease accessory protein UreD [Rhizobiaceae bacterium]
MLAPLPIPLQRALGKSEISFKTRNGETVLDDLYQQGCAKIRLARKEPARLTEAVLINTTGGLTDGDDYTTNASWGKGTTAIVTTQAAERFYQIRDSKTSKAKASIVSNLKVGEDACAFWLPQESIMFDGAAYQRKTIIDLAESAKLVAVESSVFGRAAMGESVDHGYCREIWQLRIAGKLVFADAFELDGPVAKKLNHPTIANGANAISTIIYAGPEAKEMRDMANAIFDDSNDIGRASCLGPVTIIRILSADSQKLRLLVVPILEKLMNFATSSNSNNSLLPRVWSL